MSAADSPLPDHTPEATPVAVAHEQASALNRREAVKAGALVAAGAAVAMTGVTRHRARTPTPDPVGKRTIRSLTVLNNVKPQPDEDVLLRMQRELVRAMAKPVEQRRWVMV